MNKQMENWTFESFWSKWRTRVYEILTKICALYNGAW